LRLLIHAWRLIDDFEAIGRTVRYVLIYVDYGDQGGHRWRSLGQARQVPRTGEVGCANNLEGLEPSNPDPIPVNLE